MNATVLACSCGTRYNVSTLNPGQKIRCKKCQAVLVVPAAGAPVPAQPAVAAPAARAAAPAPHAAASSARTARAGRRGRGKSSAKGEKNPALLYGGIAAAVVVGVAVWAMARGRGLDAPPFDPSAHWTSLFAPAPAPVAYAEVVSFLPEAERAAPVKERLNELADQIKMREECRTTVTAKVAKVLTSTGTPKEIADQLAIQGAFLLGQVAPDKPWRQLYVPWAEEEANRLLTLAFEKDPTNLEAHTALGHRVFRLGQRLGELQITLGNDRIPKELLEAHETFVPAPKYEELVKLDGETAAALDKLSGERAGDPYVDRVLKLEADLGAQTGFRDREWYSTGVEFKPVLVFAEKKAGFDYERVAKEKAAMLRFLHEQFVKQYVEPWGLEPESDMTFPLVTVVVQKREDYASLMVAIGTPAPGAQIANYDLSSKKVIMFADGRPGNDKLSVMMNHMFVFHEATHQMVDAYDGDTTHTYFFYEGFAEFNGSCDKDGDRWMLQQPSLYRLRQLGNMFDIKNVWPQAPVDEMVFSLYELWYIPYAGAMANAVVGRVAAAKWGPGSISMAQTGYYGQSWSVHYFLAAGLGGKHLEGYRKFLEWEMTGKVNEKLKAGQTGSQIVLEALGLTEADLAQLEADWRTFAKELIADPASHPHPME